MTIQGGDPHTRRRMRDWAALVALTVGAATVLAAAYIWTPLAGLGVTGLLLICFGVFAGIE